MLNFYTKLIGHFKPPARAIFAGCAVLIFQLCGCGVESVDQYSETVELRIVTLSGNVTSEIHAPVAHATVTCLNNGKTAQTDAAGNFSLGSSELESDEKLDLLIESAEFSIVVSDLMLSTSSSSFQITIQLSPDLQSAQAILDGESATTGSPQDDKTEPDQTAPNADPHSLFSPAGDTTGFEIPRGIVGNVHQGKKAYVRECSVCHSMLEGGNENFPQLKRTLAGAPMFIKLHDSDLADIVAYLHFKAGDR